ncbi:MAG: adenylate/guanylate cyclase domain-containing protein [Spirochaetaceae bacterium]|nr:adenylate/guanylate cyclase domain-containing protein [Spirochaetaceae bacterium]
MKTTSLAAILFAELYGFGERLHGDERAALDLLAEWRALADPVVAEHSGELVDATGDELLVVFSSAVAALQCALHLELALNARNHAFEGSGGSGPAGLLLHRIGLHIGEIWRDEARVYGNGVNVAARVKAEAGAGEILASEDFFRQVSNKLDIEARELPPRGLKNIERPLALFAIGQAARARSAAGAAAPSGTPTAAPVTRASSVPPAPPAPYATQNAPHSTHSTHSTHAGLAPPAAPAPPPGLRSSTLGEAIAARVERAIAEGAEIRVGPAGEAPETEGGAGAVGKRRISIVIGEKRKHARADRIAKSAVKLVGASLVAAAFLWLYSGSNNAWALAGALLLGILPAASGLKKLLVALFDKDPD